MFNYSIASVPNSFPEESCFKCICYKNLWFSFLLFLFISHCFYRNVFTKTLFSNERSIPLKSIFLVEKIQDRSCSYFYFQIIFPNFQRALHDKCVESGYWDIITCTSYTNIFNNWENCGSQDSIKDKWQILLLGKHALMDAEKAFAYMHLETLKWVVWWSFHMWS